ncbi:MAG: methyltransferase domain-containing protein [Verrucomicrobiota bacterium]
MDWFIRTFCSTIKKPKIDVLDVGSFDVNGTYKPLFNDPKYRYSGLDMEAGPNVDIVLENPYDWSALESDSYDVVISGQAFEHVEFFWKTMEEMTRVLKKDGLLCLIAPRGFIEHRYPVDCYRFFTDGMMALARWVSLTPLHAHTNCAPNFDDIEWYSSENADSMLVAKKDYAGKPQHPDFRKYQCIPPDQVSLRQPLMHSRNEAGDH